MDDFDLYSRGDNESNRSNMAGTDYHSAEWSDVDYGRDQ